MAGDGHHGPLKHDPAIDRWYIMRENAHERYRFTRPSVRTGIIMMVVIPGLLAWVASTQDMKWDWRAKRKGQSLLNTPQGSE